MFNIVWRIKVHFKAKILFNHLFGAEPKVYREYVSQWKQTALKIMYLQYFPDTQFAPYKKSKIHVSFYRTWDV